MFDTVYHINNVMHTVVGSVALLGGLIALISIKGSANHKKAGRVFALFIIISAVSSLFPTFYKFREIGPISIIMAIATIYFVVTALLAIRNQHEKSVLIEKLLVAIPLALIVMPIIRVIIAFKSGNYEIFMGPLALIVLFAYCLMSDFSSIRNRDRTRAYWIKRHLTRMIFAFSFGVMALVRIGTNFGLSFEMSVILPLIGAFVLVVFFRRDFQD